MICSTAAPIKIVFAVTAVGILANTAGCRSRKTVDLQKVQGSVQYRGKSLDHGRVVFVPVRGTSGPPALGEIQADGSFRMQTNEQEGAAEGKYKVMIQCREIPAPSANKQMILLKSLIPEKFSNDSSPFEFEVKPGVNQYPISLD
ncbi:MAG: hypothetical protein JXB10_09205 [Pirellulales bacterium]|nr:hypothetical protein [Pirellulales bacterium]